MGFSIKTKHFVGILLLLLTAAGAAFAAPVNRANVVIEKGGTLGIIKGVVRDEFGSPIGDASVAIFRAGTSKILKQVSSASDGSFLAKIIPGTYTILAVAQGFNPVTLFGVEVNRAAELNYGFKLERSGGGNTLPEKRLDRNSSKWRIRAAQTQRSIYQNREGDTQVDEAVAESEDDHSDDSSNSRRSQAVVETYFAQSPNGNFGGINFATQIPAGERSGLVLAGQVAAGRNAPLRLETAFTYRLNNKHQLRVNSSVGRLGTVTVNNSDKQLGQVTFQALDEWKIREGIIFVYGLDYSRFVGAGDDVSISPRLGLQFDINARTRLSSALTSQTEARSWANSIDLEGMNIAFAEPVAVQDLVVSGGKPQMNKTRRIEFGVERIIDNRSSVEASAFFDTTFGRGVGLNASGFETLGDGFGDLTANQQGRTDGIRVVYTRRLNGPFTASAGYSFGNGQRLSTSAISDPAHIFESDFFQSFFAQLAAELKTGTSVRTIYRLSPEATVFAIDPFKGRLAIYDPGLSVLVTQRLPNLGLPFRAQAILDARNLFDFQSGVSGDEGSLRLSGQGRMLRGGIQVRF